MEPKVITANSFGSGEVIYLGLSGWVSRIEDAQVFSSEDLVEGALAKANAAPSELIGPYAIAVKTDQGPVAPVSLRERIRALGPGNPHHGKQAGNEAQYV
jgi:sulfite reductase (NADPH) hemoprotein beta-component